jgi:hypothetical protein
VRHYPHAVVDLIRSDVGFLRRARVHRRLPRGVIALLVLVWRRRMRDSSTSLLTAGAFLGFAYVLAAPVFSAFRLELVFVPIAAYGLGLLTELVAARIAEGDTALDQAALPVPARARRS